MNCTNCKFKTCTPEGLDYCAHFVWEKDATNPETCTFYDEKVLPSLTELRERSKPKTAPVTEAEKQYWLKVNTADKRGGDMSFEILLNSIDRKKIIQKPVIQYPYTFDECKMLWRRAYENILAKLGKDEPVYDDEAKLDELIKYFSGQPCRYNPHKGIYLFGVVGVGKSIIMEAFITFCNTIEGRMKQAGQDVPGRGFITHTAKNIVMEVSEYKKPENLKKYYDKPICIDDFGVEDALKYFGNDMDVIADVILQRYSRFQATGLITHATSNLKSEDWKARYGDRIESRCSEMFNLVKLEGDDKRKINQLKIKMA